MPIFLLMASMHSGCAWEDSEGPLDSGHDDDGYTVVDQGPTYPPGPYGVNFGDTVANFTVYKCLCSGDHGQGRAWDMAEYLGTKALLVSAHAGSCSVCKEQARRMEPDFHDVYESRGFDILLVLISDDHDNTSREAVLDYCCYYKSTYDLNFVVAADPAVEVMNEFIRSGTPLNMVVDEEMVIRYREEGYNPSLIRSSIERVLGE